MATITPLSSSLDNSASTLSMSGKGMLRAVMTAYGWASSLMCILTGYVFIISAALNAFRVTSVRGTRPIFVATLLLSRLLVPFATVTLKLYQLPLNTVLATELPILLTAPPGDMSFAVHGVMGGFSSSVLYC